MKKIITLLAITFSLTSFAKTPGKYVGKFFDQYTWDNVSISFSGIGSQEEAQALGVAIADELNSGNISKAVKKQLARQVGYADQCKDSGGTLNYETKKQLEMGRSIPTSFIVVDKYLANGTQTFRTVLSAYVPCKSAKNDDSLSKLDTYERALWQYNR